MDFRINKKREFKKFTFPSSNKPTGKVSYCCFILFKNNKVLLATRSHSFYCSYIYVTLNKTTFLSEQQVNKIISCIKNLNIIEFLDFLCALINEEIICPNIYFSKKEIDTLKRMDETNNVKLFKSCNMKELIDTNNTHFMFELEKILFDFRDMYFDNKKIKDLEIDGGFTIILPGGKKEFGDKSCKETIIREVMEEINLNIDINEVAFLNHELEFVNFKNNDLSATMDCFTKDKVLNNIYNDKIFILKIDKDDKEAIKNFKPNAEIGTIFTMDVKIDFNNMCIKSLKQLIKIYKSIY